MSCDPKDAPAVLITGNTFPVRNAIKALGGKWDRVSRGWLVPSENAARARAIVGDCPRPWDADNDPFNMLNDGDPGGP